MKVYLIGQDSRIPFVSKFLNDKEFNIPNACYEAFNIANWDRPGIVIFFPFGYDFELIVRVTKEFGHLLKSRNIETYLVCSPAAWEKIEPEIGKQIDGAIHAVEMKDLLEKIKTVFCS